MQQRWEGCCKCTRERRRGKELISMGTFSKQRLENQKGQDRAGNKQLPEIEHSGPQCSSPEPVKNIKVK
jgi:hypothetical protein